MLIEERSIARSNAHPEARNPLFRMVRYVARVITALAAGAVRGILHCLWHLAYFLLCLFRPVVNVLMLGGVIMPLVAFVAFVKPDAANGMPFWVFLLLAAGFVGVALGYSRFVDWFAPPSVEDPAERYRQPDWR